MAKKFVRGITDIKTINNQDFDTNNVNDLLSDGEHNYIHRKKKDKSEEYHNLTDNIKTISSDNTDLLSVTNNNDTTNSATLHPKHDVQKEQSLESTRSTITIHHGTNGTDEKTTVDTNPQKVLEHENLITDYGIIKTTVGNTTKIGFEYTQVREGFNLDNFNTGYIKSYNGINRPTNSEWFFVSAYSLGNYIIQDAVTIFDNNNTTFRRYKNNGVWGPWREQVGDKSAIDNLLSLKQNKLTNNTSIGVSGNGLQQLYSQKQSYTHDNGFLKTHVKSVSANTSVSTPEEEYNFIVKINKGATSATFTLNEHDKTKFSNIITTYGTGNAVRINGCLFSLSESTLTVSTEVNTGSNYVITFSDII